MTCGRRDKRVMDDASRRDLKADENFVKAAS